MQTARNPEKALIVPAQSPLCVHSRSDNGMPLASAIFRLTSFRTLHVVLPRDIVRDYLKVRKYNFFIAENLRKGGNVRNFFYTNRTCFSVSANLLMPSWMRCTVLAVGRLFPVA